MSKNAPAIPLFTDAYLADTRHLSLEEHGAYLQLLMVAWRSPDCSLPDDDKRLARVLGITPAKWAKLKETVMAFWDNANGHWTQKRLTKERKFVDEKRAAQRANAETKWASPERLDARDHARTRAARLAEARKKGRHTQEEWESLLTLTGQQCVRCRAQGVDLVKDHITPIYLGGSDGIENIQPLCIRCNSSKSSDTTDHRLSCCNDLFERLPNARRSPAPPPPPIAAKAASAREEKSEGDAVSLMIALHKAAGLVPPDPANNWAKHSEAIALTASWLKAGADPAMLEKCVAARAKSSTVTPKSLKYYDGAVRDQLEAAAGQQAAGSSLAEQILKRKAAA